MKADRRWAGRIAFYARRATRIFVRFRRTTLIPIRENEDFQWDARAKCRGSRSKTSTEFWQTGLSIRE